MILESDITDAVEEIIIKEYRVSASVYPTPHDKTWLSSGRVPLYYIDSVKEHINFSVFAVKLLEQKAYKLKETRVN